MCNKLKVVPSRRKRIIDPSAGDGRILDYLNKACSVPLSNLFACEIEPEFVFLLQGKKYQVLGRDFLEFSEPVKFDCILANPPFADDVRHALMMWEILDDDGEMVCLLNWESVCFIEEAGASESITRYQQVLGGLVRQHGHLEYKGQCFKDSERPTNVEVGLIYLQKPPKARKTEVRFSVDFDANADNPDFNASFLANTDTIRAIVAQYSQAVKLVRERAKIQAELDFYLKGMPKHILGGVTDEELSSLRQVTPLDAQLKALKFNFWALIFKKTNVGQRTTSDFQEKFEAFVLANSSMSFSETNIREVMGVFLENLGTFMQDAVILVFDKATAYHKKNKIHHEGWVTNKGWKVNSRIIIPDGVTYDANWDSFSKNDRNSGFFRDLDRVLCWISGADVTDPDFLGTYETLDDFCTWRKKRNLHYSSVFYSTFFAMRMYKKGTLHLDFQDIDLLDEFNRIAAEGKKWVGGQGF